MPFGTGGNHLPLNQGMFRSTCHFLPFANNTNWQSRSGSDERDREYIVTRYTGEHNSHDKTGLPTRESPLFGAPAVSIL
jgi:hypothetical protein